MGGNVPQYENVPIGGGIQLRLADRFPLKEAMADLLVFPED
ncbi:hypothetical protein KSZ_53900 [Dictyobacter formicarum]|uniref:Uncharacterized protein n=1 Tax=Dictyobacter formicarum TaxID=2778368 RepID=A0ABQ3VNZ6_9CHLR|nr:hypothetical protein KSZ_53900 [Dictyobacter formicarum]